MRVIYLNGGKILALGDRQYCAIKIALSRLGIQIKGSEMVRDRWTNELEINNFCNVEGNPTGGTVKGVGIDIKWQEGPLGWDYVKNTYPEGVTPNGAFTEDICLALIERVKFFQEGGTPAGKFKCRENAIVLTHLEEALMWMQKRHDARVARNVQGEHKS